MVFNCVTLELKQNAADLPTGLNGFQENFSEMSQ